MKKLIFDPYIMWDWNDFGVMFRVYRNSEYSDYYISIDIQIAWCNLWVKCFKKN